MPAPGRGAAAAGGAAPGPACGGSRRSGGPARRAAAAGPAPGRDRRGRPPARPAWPGTAARPGRALAARGTGSSARIPMPARGRCRCPRPRRRSTAGRRGRRCEGPRGAPRGGRCGCRRPGCRRPGCRATPSPAWVAPGSRWPEAPAGRGRRPPRWSRAIGRAGAGPGQREAPVEQHVEQRLVLEVLHQRGLQGAAQHAPVGQVEVAECLGGIEHLDHGHVDVGGAQLAQEAEQHGQHRRAGLVDVVVVDVMLVGGPHGLRCYARCADRTFVRSANTRDTRRRANGDWESAKQDGRAAEWLQR